MKPSFLAFAAALGTLCAPLARASDWVALTEPDALRALYSNRTFKGKDWMDRPVVAHYRADGQGVMFLKGARIPLRWAVNGRDQVCVVWSAHKDCYRIEKHKAKTGTFLLIDVNTDVKRIYAVEEGIPSF